MLFMSPLLASVLAILFYFLSVFVHIMVIKQVIPFQWVNGGRSESYEKQKQMSLKSIPVLVLGFTFVFIGYLYPSFRETLIFCIIAFALALFWALGFVMQLLGSKFEKYVMTFILLLGVLSHVELALVYVIG